MEKRAVVAIAVSFLILVIWSWMFPPSKPEPQPAAGGASVEAPAGNVTPAGAPAETAPAGAATDDAAASGATGEGAAAAATMPAGEGEAAPADGGGQPVMAADETSETIDTDHFSVEFTNRGGRVRAWRLHGYDGADGKPLSLFPEFVDQAPLPLGIDLDDELLSAQINDALFQVRIEALPADGDAGPGRRIVFEWSDGRGLSVDKSFTFRQASWLVDVEVHVTDRGRPLTAALTLGPGFAVQEPRSGKSTYYYADQGAWNVGGKVERLKSRKLVAESGSRGGDVLWGGMEDQYFTALVLPKSDRAEVRWRSEELTPQPATWEEVEKPAEPKAEPLVSVSLPDGEGRLYVGPKKYTLLARLGHELDKSVWFSSNGFLYAISKFLFIALLWIHDRVAPNFGLAIILATMALRIMLFPVNQYSMVSMKKTQLQMQRLQPKLKAIRNKYKKSKDAESRTKMNDETMKLYKAEGVNPAGGLSGCLPMLAQFPILIGFYNMLTVAVELRGAPFALWIHDLSQKDPFWVLPLLMGVTMFAQQKMAMSRVKDPQQQQQQKIMMVMPFVFTYICLQMPSGMVLYWFVNNLLGIGQQWLVNRHTGRLEAAAQKA